MIAISIMKFRLQSLLLTELVNRVMLVSCSLQDHAGYVIGIRSKLDFQNECHKVLLNYTIPKSFVGSGQTRFACPFK